MNDIEIQNGTVLKDGKEVGTIGEDGKFSPVKGLHYKTVAAINLRLTSAPHPSASEESSTDDSPEPVNEPAPAQDPRSGDKTPDYVAWYARNHSEAEFIAKYPLNRKLTRPE